MGKKKSNNKKSGSAKSVAAPLVVEEPHKEAPVVDSSLVVEGDSNSAKDNSNSLEEKSVEPEVGIEPSNTAVESELDRVKKERDDYEAQYNSLLGRLSSMKTIFSKMKESQQELDVVREQLAEYETQNLQLKDKLASVRTEKEDISRKLKAQDEKFSKLESENRVLKDENMESKKKLKTLDTQLGSSSTVHKHELQLIVNERDELATQLEELMIVLNNNKQDIIDLKETNSGLQSQVSKNNEEKAVLEDSITALEKELESSSRNFKDTIQQKDLEVTSLRAQLDASLNKDADNAKIIAALRDEVLSLQENLKSNSHLAQQNQEHVEQIGKLRHEVIVLNEHLTKAMAMLKQSSESETIDKELISNLLISFVSIPRADARKFEVLELISEFLSWDNDKKQQAGLIHDKSGGLTSKSRTPSRTESFVSMWTDYLEKESEADRK